MISYQNTAKEIQESGVDTAILPLGSVEQHSSHLPVGTDFMLAEALGKQIAERLNAWLLPALPISTCYEHKGAMGSVWMRPNTFYQMLQDIILSLRSQGICKVIVILGHGGIFVAAPAIRELNALYDDMQVIIVEPSGDYPEILEDPEPELHAGERETSLMLYLYEDLVRKEQMQKNDFTPHYPRNFLNYASIHRLSKTGAWGKPSLATKEKGEKLFQARVQWCIEYIEEACKVIGKEAW